MIATLAWKEYREHRLFWAALACLSALLVAGLWQVLEPAGSLAQGSHKAEILTALAIILAAIYGLLCGCLMLAGEREAGTLPFLQVLAGQRGPIWRTKCAAGLALTVAQTLAIAGLLFAIGLKGPMNARHGMFWLGALAVLPLVAFGWGMLASAFCRNSLAAVALAIGFFLLAQLPVALVLFLAESDGTALAAEGLLGAAALVASERVFAGRRQRREMGAPSVAGWRVLIWLTARQGWSTVAVVGVLSVAVGLVLPSTGPQLWPIATLVIGVLCGVAVWGDEQTGPYQRFLGDQRLSPGYIWAVKTAVWLAVAVAMGCLILGAGLARNVFEGNLRLAAGIRWWKEDTFLRATGLHSRDFLSWVSPGILLTVWLAYGFSTALVLAMLSRKGLVARTLAFLIGATALGLWIPSLVAGGLNAWQVFLPPLLLIIASRLAMWPWLAGRLGQGKPAFCLAACGVLCAAWLAGSLAYRVWEVPDVGEPFDIAAFEASLPTPEKNKAGRLILDAAKLFEEQRKREIKDSEIYEYEKQIRQVLSQGWPDEDSPLGPLLDRMCGGEWVEKVREAAALPLGMLQDPRDVAAGEPVRAGQFCLEAGKYLCARALQIQARGDSRLALNQILTVLALSRNLRNKAPTVVYIWGEGVEMTAIGTVARWRQQLPAHDRAGPLRRALDGFTRHEAQRPPETDQYKADYLFFLRQAAISPMRWLPNFSENPPPWKSVIWQAPWERVHRSRILSAVVAGWLRALDAAPEGRGIGTETGSLGDWLPAAEGPAAALTADRLQKLVAQSRAIEALTWSPLRRHTYDSLRSVRKTRLELAVDLSEAVESKRPQTVNDLIPTYLAEPLIDPITGSPFPLPQPPGGKVEKSQAP